MVFRSQHNSRRPDIIHQLWCATRPQRGPSVNKLPVTHVSAREKKHLMSKKTLLHPSPHTLPPASAQESEALQHCGLPNSFFYSHKPAECSKNCHSSQHSSLTETEAEVLLFGNHPRFSAQSLLHSLQKTSDCT